MTNENRTLKDHLEQTKDQNKEYNGDLKQLVEVQRQEIEDMRDNVQRLKADNEKQVRKAKERYEDQYRHESEKYQRDYEVLRQEMHIMQRKLGSEEQLNRELGNINRRQDDQRAQYAQSHKPDFMGADDILDADMIEWKNRIAQLSREGEEVTREVRSMMKRAPES